MSLDVGIVASDRLCYFNFFFLGNAKEVATHASLFFVTGRVYVYVHLRVPLILFCIATLFYEGLLAVPAGALDRAIYNMCFESLLVTIARGSCVPKVLLLLCCRRCVPKVLLLLLSIASKPFPARRLTRS